MQPSTTAELARHAARSRSSSDAQMGTFFTTPRPRSSLLDELPAATVDPAMLELSNSDALQRRAEAAILRANASRRRSTR